MAIGIKLTASLEYFLATRCPKEFTTISFGKGVKDESGRGARFIKDNWDVQQTDALANTTITVEFLQSMQEFVRSYVKG